MTHLLSVTAVAPVEAGILRITWDDGVTRLVDLQGKFRGHMLLDMLNIPEVFRDVSVVPGGGGIEWINGADLSARSLRLWSDEEIATARKSA